MTNSYWVLSVFIVLLLIIGVLIWQLVKMHRDSRQNDGYRDFLFSILDNLPFPIMVKDIQDDFVYKYWNKESEVQSKVDRKTLIGHNDYEIYGRERGQRYRDIDTALVQSGKPYVADEQYEKEDGTIIDTRVWKTIVRWGEHDKWLLVVRMDVTEQNAYARQLEALKEKAEEANTLKSAFIANMSHEIRTPLNAIVGFSDMLCQRMGSEQDQQDYMAIITKNNELLLKLIGDILDFSRMEANMMEFTPSYTDVNELLNTLHLQTQRKCPKGVEVIFTDRLPDCLLYIDSNRLAQVIINLLDNAVKFTSQGSIKMGYVMDEASREIYFYVRDTGIGIAPEKQPTIFDRFVKLDSFVSGTGLGLPLCRVIVQKLGGTIGVISEAGKGAEFWFRLPMTLPASEPILR